MKPTRVDPPFPRHNFTDSLNARAFSATTHCLTGCALGEVMGMTAGAALNWNNALTNAVSTALAFVFGYAFTLGPLLHSGVAFRTAVGLALASETLSIAVMEIVDKLLCCTFPVL